MIESKEPKAQNEPLPGMMPTLAQETFTYSDVAAMLKVSKQTVMEWVKRGKVPSPNYIGATARFTREQVKVIISGPRKEGTFDVAESPRSETAKEALAPPPPPATSPAKPKPTPKRTKSLDRKKTNKPTPKPKKRKAVK